MYPSGAPLLFFLGKKRALRSRVPPSRGEKEEESSHTKEIAVREKEEKALLRWRGGEGTRIGKKVSSRTFHYYARQLGERKGRRLFADRAEGKKYMSHEMRGKAGRNHHRVAMHQEKKGGVIPMSVAEEEVKSQIGERTKKTSGDISGVNVEARFSHGFRLHSERKTIALPIPRPGEEREGIVPSGNHHPQGDNRGVREKGGNRPHSKKEGREKTQKNHRKKKGRCS